MEINGEDLLASLNRLLEGLHQAGLTNFGNHLSIIYVAPGAQHVDTIQNQYQQASAQNLTPAPSPKGEGKEPAGKDANPPFDADTPLSALFRENHHEELRTIIESWRPFLKDDETDTKALELSAMPLSISS